jgi:GH25 family lysozyme M1 (1,4-beta-N-acetylmuramidase)
MDNSELAFGIDLSRWNTSADGKKKVDFDVIAAHPDPIVSFIAMRSGVSWGYQDPWFSYYFAEALRIKRVRMVYHVLYPGENPIKQMDNFFRIIGDGVDYSQLPLVLDLELDHGYSKSRITSCTNDCINIIYKRTGYSPIIYSRTSWVDYYLDTSSLFKSFWWLAQYRWPRPYPLFTPEYPCPPNPLPIGVSSWLIHQTGSRCPSIGSPTYFMDYNRFNGSVDDLFSFIGLNLPKPVTCPIDGNPCCRIFV